MAQSGPVAVAVPGKFFLSLHYNSPDPVVVGARVRVTLGKKPVIGIVTAHSHPHRPVTLKNVIAILDKAPLLSPAVLNLLQWASNYYAHPLGDSICHALPNLLAQGETAEVSQITQYQAQPTPSSTLETLKKAKAQAALWALMEDGLPRGLSELKQLGHKRAAVTALLNKALLIETQTPRDCLYNPTPKTGPRLNAEQQIATDSITQSLGQNTRFVLHGITGSGKTEVYLSTAKQALTQGLSVLILVPEIGLTPQFLNRVLQRLATPLAVLHSGLSNKDRKDNWLLAQSGQAKVVIGTRSAIYTPIPNLGLIIVDEEHDAAFKQQEHMRYHARDLALVRARQADIPVVLGSATPSSETLANIDRGQYQRLTLTKRATGQTLPAIKAVDLKAQTLKNGLSQQLINRIRHHVQQDHQALLFLNRRGVAPALLCHECGWSADCQNCDSRMTLHRSAYRDVLRCHHCGHSHTAPQQCQSCGSSNLITPGAGTAGLEETLTTLFPDYSILRIDRDNTRSSQALETALKKATEGKVDILVGTQMLAKGHHFPKLTLVGVIDADSGLYSSDYRATERLAQQIEQVAGRAGREAPGEVLIQTHMPEHPALQALCTNGYSGVMQHVLAERKQALWPPYSTIALVRGSHPQAGKAENFAHMVAALAQQAKTSAQILGPVLAPMPRKANRWRYQVMIQTTSRAQRSELLTQLVPAIDQHKLSHGIRWSVDVDPVDLF